MLSLSLLPKQYFGYLPVQLLQSCEANLFFFMQTEKNHPFQQQAEDFYLLTNW
jgi:hypothetical protein